MARPRSSAWVDDAHGVAAWILSIVVGVSLLFLTLRAYTRLELRWDTWQYHLAYAAKAGGIKIPFHMDEQLLARFEGYPPLAHFIEGALWRVTGSVNATGLINVIGFGAFLAVCHRFVRAPFYIVGLIALTTPLVIIHLATNYIDLFANSFVAIAVVVLIHVYVFNRQHERSLLIVGLSGAVVASWSKLPLVPVAAVVFVLYAVVYRIWEGHDRFRNLRVFGVAAVVASLPFVRNLVLHANPLWPTRTPGFVGDAVPRGGAVSLEQSTQVPPPLADASQPELFFRSLFEIDHPWHYPDRPRWNLDQGGGQIAYRSGGFWFIGVLVFLAVMIALLVIYGGRRGRVVAGASGVALALVSFLPQSHVLRYYLFIPLVWAGVIGMFFPRLRKRDPAIALGFCVLALVLFWSMFRANQSYYKVERVNYQDAAQYWGSARMWPYLRGGVVYCDVHDQSKPPRSLTMTGPTMREFTVYVRPTVADCPTGSVPIIDNVVHYEDKT